MIAPALVRDLAESSEVVNMRLLDIAGERATAVADSHGLGGEGRSHSTCPADDLAAALTDCDVLLNCASYRLNIDAMRACLKASCYYLDLGGLYWMTGGSSSLDEQFREAGLLALLLQDWFGSRKTNVMAERAGRWYRLSRHCT